MFKGTYHHRIDPKGRLPVPAPFRRRLAREGAGQSLVVTLLDECLAVYPPGQNGRGVEAQLRAMPPFSKPVKALARVLASHAVDCELDVQGRIRLPPLLRKAIGLESEAVVVGVVERFEIWAPDRWDRFLSDSERLLGRRLESTCPGLGLTPRRPDPVRPLFHRGNLVPRSFSP